MTDRLYYHDSFLYEFDAQVVGVDASALVLDRTAFYPTSGGQVFDTGWIVADGAKLRVKEVAEKEDGTIVHMLEDAPGVTSGARIHGQIDIERRRDHMQQHSGQHVLSAAFVRLFDMPTVSFHMGEDSCSIDLDTKSLSPQQVQEAERLANDIITQDRPVAIRFVTQDEARELGLRKVPPVEREKLRLIDIHDFDLTACGGTHVRTTGQIGSILLRKTEKVRQGFRAEFVCGKRAVETARKDYAALTEAAGLFSSHIWEVADQVRKTQEESRVSRKANEQLLGEIAEMRAEWMLAATPETNGRRVIVHIEEVRGLNFIKLLAQKITRQSPHAVALLASRVEPAALVFAQTPGQPFDMGALMKEALAKLGGRGGGSKDMAQGGPLETAGLSDVLSELAGKLNAG